MVDLAIGNANSDSCVTVMNRIPGNGTFILRWMFPIWQGHLALVFIVSFPRSFVNNSSLVDHLQCKRGFSKDQRDLVMDAVKIIKAREANGGRYDTLMMRFEKDLFVTIVMHISMSIGWMR